MNLRFNIKDDATRKKRLIPIRKHYPPMRFVGIGLIVTLVLVFILYKLIVK